MMDVESVSKIFEDSGFRGFKFDRVDFIPEHNMIITYGKISNSEKSARRAVILIEEDDEIKIVSSSSSLESAKSVDNQTRLKEVFKTIKRESKLEKILQDGNV